MFFLVLAGFLSPPILQNVFVPLKNFFSSSEAVFDLHRSALITHQRYFKPSNELFNNSGMEVSFCKSRKKAYRTHPFRSISQ